VQRITDIEIVLARKVSDLLVCLGTVADNPDVLVERVSDLPQQSIRRVRKEDRCFIAKIFVVIFD
jgi:hypothetical protein